MALTAICDFCDKTIQGGTILKHRRSILEFLRIIPKLIASSFQIDYRSNIEITKYHVCDRCRRLIEQHIFAEPNVVEELQRLCQNNVPRGHRNNFALHATAMIRRNAYPHTEEPGQIEPPRIEIARYPDLTTWGPGRAE